MEAKKMHAKALPSAPTLHNSKEAGYIKAIGSDEPITPQGLGNVTEIDGGILEYVRERMHRKTITPEVRRQAVMFEREMSRMKGW
jgi:hypothetical protein